MTRPEISAELVAAYRSTEYRVRLAAGFSTNSGCPFILRVDQYSAPLSQLFSASGRRCAAFITACNPFSVSQSREANHAVCARLRDELIRHAAHPEQIIEGEGRDPRPVWSMARGKKFSCPRPGSRDVTGARQEVRTKCYSMGWRGCRPPADSAALMSE